jgi:flagellar biosynthesis/type III secretory pathway protein FliH
MPDIDVVLDQIEDALCSRALSITDEGRRQIESVLSTFEDEAKQEGHDEGYAKGLRDNEFADVDHATLDDLHTGLDLLKKGDALSAPVYLDRALRDFGSTYY